MKIYQITLLIASVSLMACESLKKSANETVKEVEDSAMGQTIDLDYMDNSVRAQDDFFMFANGTWVKNNPVPATESRWGSFNELDQSNKRKLTTILEEAVRNPGERGSVNQMLGAYYESFKNMEVRNELGISPIESDLLYIDQLIGKDELIKLIARQHKDGINSLFRFGVRQDLKDVNKHIASFSQGGLGLPNKDYYLKEDKKEIRDKYRLHIEKMLVQCAYDEEAAKKAADAIFNFEESLAKAMMAPAELRDPKKTYNKYDRVSAIRMFERFKFDSYLAATGIASFDTMIVSQPDFAINIARMMSEVDLYDWKEYLKWKVINHYAGHLDERFVDLNFQFYGIELRGMKEMKPINERAIEEITGMEFGEYLGKAFVEKHYSKEARDRVNKMVDDLLAVFEERITELEWMSDATKKEALTKLKAIGRKLGYPDKWEDLSSIKVDRGDYIGNIKAEANYSYVKNIEKLDKEVDRDEWGMPAHMVNAYYHPLLNEIAFPAGIMQAPFFDQNYEDAVNYGRIGMVIGHEFTHGFDDQGSMFAADGTFNNWWTEDDRALFEARTQILGNTYSAFCPVDDHCVNPQLTMGENIADLGGLTLAFHAYKRTAEYKSGVKKKGFTPAQRFFIAYAQLWKINYTEEELKNRIATDPHSPGMYRVNGPLMNCPEFFEAFDVQEGDPMRNEATKVAKIW